MTLSAAVVFITTYLLILPALTLDEQEAARQGGIDLPAQQEQVLEDTAAERSLSFDGDGYAVTADCDAKAGLPEGTELAVSEIEKDAEDYDTLCDEALQAVQAEDGGDTIKELKFARFYDISLMADGAPIEPGAPVDVTISYDKAIGASDAEHLRIVQFGENGTEVLDPEHVSFDLAEGKLRSTAFAAESFSVYALVYTVDFSYEVDGETFEYSLEGGGSIGLTTLLPLLGIVDEEDAGLFVSEIEDVQFSDDTLVKVERNEDDWVLNSRKPFDTEETLTVTMKDGQQFVVNVTDAQVSTNVLTADGKNYKITVTYDDDAEIPEGTKLVAEEIKSDSDEYLQHLGQAWMEVNREYLDKEHSSGKSKEGLEDDNLDEDIHPVNLDHARFFDVRLEINGEEVEPEAPVKVEIRYEDGIPVSETEDPEAGVVHFRKDDIELIEEVETEEDQDGNLTGFQYMQDSFSDIGTYVGQETRDDAADSVAGRIAYPKLSAMLGASSSSLKDELGEPVASKTLEDNEDGTYTLSLSVTGAAKKKDEQPKANVLFVMDRSSSMSNSNNDIYLPYKGEYKSGTTYYGSSDGKSYFTLNYSNGKYTYTDRIWPYTHDYTGTVYTRVSRLKAEQDAMSVLFNDLLENNKDESGNYTKDTVEISVISFADDRGKNE